MKDNKNLSMLSEEVIKKGKYRVFNGTDYEVIHLQTSADQVVESTEKKFVSQTEKNTWNSKADGNHNHDTRYYQKSETFTQTQINDKLALKAEKTHTHAATDIITDNNKMFVSSTEKARWNNTYTKSETTDLIGEAKTAVEGQVATVTASVTKVETDYKSADRTLQTNITNVQTNLDEAIEDLTELINNGGTANAELAERVEFIEATSIPGVKATVSALDTRVSAEIQDLEEVKANKTDVTSEINTAKTALESKINLKADKSYTDTQLGTKANKTDVYTKEEANGLLDAKADKSTMTTELDKKADKTTMTTELAKKANASDVTNSLNLKADKTALESGLATKAEKSHTHTASQVTGLGTAATKNVGTSSGQIPVLDGNGKLATSVLPKIAVNETFTAASISEAMGLTIEVGDVVILTATRSKEIEQLNEEFSTYIASGRLAYICVDKDATEFEEKFRPLQASGDTISSGEVQAGLNLKVDKTEFNSFKDSNTAAINTKANAADVYTKTQMDTSLSNKVDKVSGKGLSTNDFTAAYKTKLDGIAEGANNYVHPTGDGNLHVPATGTSNNRKFLMAGSTAGSLSWTSITASHVTQDANNRFITDAERTLWNSKAAGDHNHDSVYRKISDSLSTSQTKAEIAKLKTIVQSTQPTGQMAGAVWIETI